MVHRSLQNRRKVYHQAGRRHEEEQQNNQQQKQIDLGEETTKPKIEVKESDVAAVVAGVRAIKGRIKQYRR